LFLATTKKIKRRRNGGGGNYQVITDGFTKGY
jgi:hypothetical protein